MLVIDKICQGDLGKIYIAASVGTREWTMKREQLSPPLYQLSRRVACDEMTYWIFILASVQTQ